MRVNEGSPVLFSLLSYVKSHLCITSLVLPRLSKWVHVMLQVAAESLIEVQLNTVDDTRNSVDERDFGL
jgi:hypothetical protein